MKRNCLVHSLHAFRHLSLCRSSRKPLELRLRSSPRLQQDPLRSPPPHRRLPQRELPGAAAAGRGVIVVGRQPALHGGNSHRAGDHRHRDGHGGGGCGDGGEEQEEEPRKEMGRRITDTDVDPRVEEGGEYGFICSRFTEIHHFYSPKLTQHLSHCCFNLIFRHFWVRAPGVSMGMWKFYM